MVPGAPLPEFGVVLFGIRCVAVRRDFHGQRDGRAGVSPLTEGIPHFGRIGRDTDIDDLNLGMRGAISAAALAGRVAVNALAVFAGRAIESGGVCGGGRSAWGTRDAGVERQCVCDGRAIR